jgi:hypothetical protein
VHLKKPAPLRRIYSHKALVHRVMRADFYPIELCSIARVIGRSWMFQLRALASVG